MSHFVPNYLAPASPAAPPAVLAEGGDGGAAVAATAAEMRCEEARVPRLSESKTASDRSTHPTRSATSKACSSPSPAAVAAASTTDVRMPDLRHTSSVCIAASSARTAASVSPDPPLDEATRRAVVRRGRGGGGEE